MTLLIALEFNHTLHYAVTHDRGIIQGKIIILDLHEMTPPMLAALAALVVGLGVTYWLMRERDDRVRNGRRMAQGHAAV